MPLKPMSSCLMNIHRRLGGRAGVSLFCPNVARCCVTVSFVKPVVKLLLNRSTSFSSGIMCASVFSNDASVTAFLSNFKAESTILESRLESSFSGSVPKNPEPRARVS